MILVGEVRDRETAEVALQAALTGQLVLSTFHAGSAVAAVARLLDLGSEPFLVRSGVQAVLCQRLVRRLCDCSREAKGPDEFLGLNVETAKVAVGCPRCMQTGYQGRRLLAELLIIDHGEFPAAILARRDAQSLQAIASAAGMRNLWQGAINSVAAGDVSPAEVRRVLGWNSPDRG